MKEQTVTNSRLKENIRKAITTLIVCSLVMVAPVFSILEFGQFFHKSDSRSSSALPVMNQRAVDKTTLPPQLFQEPLVTVTFDDGFESVYKDAMPLLQQYGIHTTQYVLPGETSDQQYISWGQIQQMQDAGHEIACHTMTHPDLTTLNDTDLDYQLRECKAELTSRYGTISDFASPYGSQDARTEAAMSKYFDSQRNTNGDPTNGVSDVDVNLESNFNRYNIIGVTVHKNTSVKELQELVDYAKKNNGWVVLTYHQADGDNGSEFGVDTASMKKQFAYLSSTNVRIVTMQQALESTKLPDAEY